MNFLSAMLCAAGVCAAIWFSEKKLLDAPRGKKILAICLAIGAVTGAVGGWMAFTRVEGNWIHLARVLLSFIAMAGAAYCDLAERRIPNLFFLGMAGGFGICMLLDGILVRKETLSLMIGGVLGGGIVFVFLILLRLISKGGIGYGDIKLAAGFGLLLGWYGGFSVLFFAQLIAIVAVIVGLAIRRITMKDHFPLAPFLYFGLIGTVLFGTF